VAAAGIHERKGASVKKGVLTILATAAVTAAFWPAAGNAGTFKGIVVAKQRGVMLVASPAGSLQAVRGTASLGSRLDGLRVVGRASHATIRGILVRRIGRTLVLSSNRHLIAIPNRLGRVLAATGAASPPTTTPGAVISTGVSIQNGRLEEVDEDDVGQVNANTIAVQATVKAVGAGTVTLDVQGQSLTVSLPGALTLPATLVGQTVTINLSLANDDDQNDDQGDDDGGDDRGGDHGGHGHGHGGDGGGDD
jgi:hypothetical protein